MLIADDGRREAARVEKMRVEQVRVEVFGDHEVMHPPHRLAKALTVAGVAGAFDLAAVTRAEQALDALAPAFATFMQADLDALDQALGAVRAEGLDAGTAAALFRAAHDIKGGAATFGFPAAGRISAGLCRLLDAGEPTAPRRTATQPTARQSTSPRHTSILGLLDTHVEAIRAIVRQGARDEDAVAVALAGRLGELVDEAIGPFRG